MISAHKSSERFCLQNVCKHAKGAGKSHPLHGPFSYVISSRLWILFPWTFACLDIAFSRSVLHPRSFTPEPFTPESFYTRGVLVAKFHSWSAEPDSSKVLRGGRNSQLYATRMYLNPQHVFSFKWWFCGLLPPARGCSRLVRQPASNVKQNSLAAEKSDINLCWRESLWLKHELDTLLMFKQCPGPTSLFCPTFVSHPACPLFFLKSTHYPGRTRDFINDSFTSNA